MIRTRNLTVRYGDAIALRDVDLVAREGRILSVVGPSGCGKSSLLLALNRLIDLIPEASVEGLVEVGGRDVRAPEVDPSALRRRVGMVFQKPNPFPMSIRKNIHLALVEHGIGDRETRDEITRRVLEEVGLLEEVEDRLSARADTLSGGQQQRLCLARALALEPDVLLMDEPTSALDPLSAARVEERIAALRGRYTVVLVTHNLAQARRLSDDAAVFWVREGAGRLIECGPTARVLSRPQDPDAAAYVAGERGLAP